MTESASNSAAVTDPRALLPGIGFENLNGCAMHPSSNVMYCAATTSYTGDGVSYLVRFDDTSTEILGRLRMAVYSSAFDLAGNYHYATAFAQILTVTDPHNIAGQACVAGSCGSSTLAAAAAVLDQAGDNQENPTSGSGAVLKVQFNCCSGTSSARNHHVTESNHFTQVLRRNFADISAFQRDLDGYGSADWLIGFNAATPYDTMVVVKVSGSNAPYAVWFRVKLEGGGAPAYQIGYGAAWYYAGYPYFSSNAGNGVFQVMIDELNFINEGTCGTACQWDGTKVTIKNIGQSVPTGTNDGANCMQAPTPFPTCGNTNGPIAAPNPNPVTDAACQSIAGYIYNTAAADYTCAANAGAGCNVGAGSANVDHALCCTCDVANGYSLSNSICTKAATCGDNNGSGSGPAFVCAAGSAIKGNPSAITCGATPCATNTDPTQQAACCHVPTCINSLLQDANAITAVTGAIYTTITTSTTWPRNSGNYAGGVTLLYPFPNNDYVYGTAHAPQGYEVEFSTDDAATFSPPPEPYPGSSISHIKMTGHTSAGANPGVVLDVPEPTASSSTQSSSTGGDGFAPIVFPSTGRVMNIYHHATAKLICTNAGDGTNCDHYGGADGTVLHVGGSGGTAVSVAYVTYGTGYCGSHTGGVNTGDSIHSPITPPWGSGQKSLSACQAACTAESTCEFISWSDTKASDNCFMYLASSCTLAQPFHTGGDGNAVVSTPYASCCQRCVSPPPSRFC